jgi:hypothetical protein
LEKEAMAIQAEREGQVGRRRSWPAAGIKKREKIRAQATIVINNKCKKGKIKRENKKEYIITVWS